MLKRGIILAINTAWGIGCVPQPDETQESIFNLVQAGFPTDDIHVISGAELTAAGLWLTGGPAPRPASPRPRVSVHPCLGAISGLDLAVRS